MAPRDPIVPPKGALGLTPEVLDPVDVKRSPVSIPLHQRLGMMNALVGEPLGVERVPARLGGAGDVEPVGDHERVRGDLLADDRQQRRALEVGRLRSAA